MKTAPHHLTLLAVFFLALAALPLAASAQMASSQAMLADGKEAFREGRYAEAARAFEQAAEADKDNAEAYYLLARVYYETPLRDEKKADKALERALEIEPENVQFLVARLEQLKRESWNFFTEKVREVQRRQLAAQILKLDPANAYGHEELGVGYIRDFWRYRNAIMLPGLKFSQRSMKADISESALAMYRPELDFESDLAPDGGVNPGDTRPRQGMEQALPFDPNDVFLADRFDLKTLQEQGVPVADLSARAQKAYDRAIGHLGEALKSDPRRRPVYDAMMEIFALKGEWEDALAMLEDMYSFFPEDTKTWLYLGLGHYRDGNLDAAFRSFETAFNYMSDEAKLAFSSLDYLIPAKEKEKYEQNPDAYASRFWTSKDPRFLTPYNERKLEHYARLVYADLLYGSEDLNLRGWDTQRGRILVRYGVPQSDVILIPRNTGKTGQEIIADAQQRGSGEHSDVGRGSGAGDPMAGSRALIATQGTGFDMFAEANSFNIWDYGDFRFVFEDPFRNGEYRLYSPSATEIAEGVNPWLNDYAILAEDTFKKIPERYTYEAPGRQIEMPYLVTAFKGEGDRTDLYVHYGIPITEYDASTEMIDISANVGAFLISSDRDILVERRRTLYGLNTGQIMPFAETNLWVDTQVMNAPPGNHEVSVEFETASGGTVAVQRRGVRVPDFTADRLAVSDMLLAYRVEEAPDGKKVGKSDLVRNGLSITPAPWSVFAHTQPIYLYFEPYHLAQNAEGKTDYEVEILLVPKDQAKGLRKLVKGLFGSDKGVSIQYPVTGATPDDFQYQILDASELEPGLYTLILRIRDNLAGKTAETEQDLFLE